VAATQALAAGVLAARTPAAAARLRGLPAATRAGAGAVLRALRGNPLAMALFVVAGVLLAWRVTVVTLTGVADYDGLSYHVPMVYSWVQDHQVGQRIGVNPFSDAYPGNLELHAAWTMAIFGTDRWISVAQVPFAALGAAAVVAVARRFGVRLGWALAAAAMFLLTPAVVAQVGTIYNDVAAATAFVAGLHFAGRLLDTVQAGPQRTAGTGHAVLAGLGLGLAAGIKPSFMVGAVVTAALVLVGLCWRLRGWRRPALLLGIVGVLVAVVGAPFYLRNLVLFGNPLAPFAFHIGPLTLPGPLNLDAVTVGPSTPPELHGFGPWKTPALWAGYQTSSRQGNVQGNFGWQWPLLLVPAATGWLALLVARRRAWYPAILLIPMGTVFLTHPTPWVFRYVLFLVVPGVVAFALLLQWLAARPGKLGPAGCLVLSAALLVLAVLPFQHHFLARAGYPGVTATRTLAAPDFLRAAHATPGVRTCAQPGADWVDQLPAGTVVGVSPLDFPGCLYGRRAQHRVTGLPENPELLAGFLAEHPVGYVFARDTRPHGIWYREHPEQFELFYAAGQFRAYRVR
jgi:hypothetical protein